jgi:hypothetical protein
MAAAGLHQIGPPAPFVVGVSRSGTTLLRLMIDSHSELAIPAETRFLPELIARVDAGAGVAETAAFLTEHRRWGDFGLDALELRERLDSIGDPTPGAAARAFYALYAEGQGKPRWGDKSPPYMTGMPAIATALPEARFIHLIRDGRDVAASLMARTWGMRRPRRIARRWVREVSTARRDALALAPGTYLEVRYEELVADPERVLRAICAHVELTFEPAMLRFHERAETRLAELRDLPGHRSAAERATQFERVREPVSGSRVGAWREALAAEDIAAFQSVAADLLAELGYPIQ